VLGIFLSMNLELGESLPANTLSVVGKPAAVDAGSPAISGSVKRPVPPATKPGVLKPVLPKPGWIAVYLRLFGISGPVITFFALKFRDQFRYVTLKFWEHWFPIASAVLLLMAGTLWAFASGRVPGLFIAGLWAAALIIAAALLAKNFQPIPLVSVEGDDVERRLELERRSAVRLKDMLERLGGAAVKIGQQMALRPDVLPEIYCDVLKDLFDESAEAIDPPTVRQIVGEALIAKRVLYDKRILQPGCSAEKALSEVFRCFDEKHPIGKASIACVYPAILFTGQKVAVKVMRPRIKRTIALDLAVLNRLLKTLEFLTLIKPGLSETFQREIRLMLEEELNFRKEIRYQEIFRLYHPKKNRFRVSAPKVYYDYSDDRVIVSEFVQGISAKVILRAIDERNQEALQLLDQFNIDRKVVAKRLVRASHYGFFECPFFHGDPHPGNILVRPNNRIYLLDFGACGVFAEKERKVLRQMHQFKSQDDIGGMVQCVVKLAEPLPPIDVFAFTKRLEDEWWHGSYGIESKHAEWWERTSYRLWVALTRTAWEFKMPLPLNMLRMIRATLLYDTVAGKLYPKINVFKEYAKYNEKYAAGVQRQMIRSFCKQVLTGPDPKTFVRVQQAVDTGNLLLFRLRRFLDEPFPNFTALISKACDFINSLFKFAFIAFNLTFLAAASLLFLYMHECPGEPWSDAPNYFLRTWPKEKGMSLGKWIGIVWLILLILYFYRFYRQQKFRLMEREID
jgi:ubiquinone biosynthesis protein